jgi:GBP family porin
MNKKFVSHLLLASAALPFSAFSADSNVQIYGVIDTGIFYTNQKTAGVTQRTTTLDSGGEAGSRIGFKGSEDLSNGYKLNFLLESGFASDTGASTQSRLFGRGAWLGISGDFGEIRAGRQTTAASEYALTGLSPFPVHGQAGLGKTGFTASDSVRNDDQIKYISPNFNNFAFATSYSLKTKGDAATSNNENVRAFSLGGQYKTKTYTALATIDRIFPSKNDPLGSNKKPTSIQIGGNATFDNVTVYLAWAHNKDGWIKSSDGAPTGTTNLGSSAYFNGTSQTYLAGLKYKHNAHSVFGTLQYIKAPNSLVDSESTKVTSIGYTYTLSKRTNFYSYATRHFGGQAYTFKKDSATTQLAAGIRHNF